MSTNTQDARAVRVKFESMYSDGGKHALSADASAKLDKLKAGCCYRAALDELANAPGTDGEEARAFIQQFIAREPATLWELFERA
jgi:hypothetical protein